MHRIGGEANRHSRAVEMLDDIGPPREVPMAEAVICDEPVSTLVMYLGRIVESESWKELLSAPAASARLCPDRGSAEPVAPPPSPATCRAQHPSGLAGNGLAAARVF